MAKAEEDNNAVNRIFEGKIKFLEQDIEKAR